MKLPSIHADIIALGGKLIRAKNHAVYLLPNGVRYTVALTPSDRRAELNQLSDLRRALGLTPQHQPGERRQKRHKPGRQGSMSPKLISGTSARPTLAEQLRKALGEKGPQNG